MDVRSHFVTQRLVDYLVLLDHVFTGKYIAYDDCREMRTITLHLDLTARDTGLDQPCNIFNLHGIPRSGADYASSVNDCSNFSFLSTSF